MTPAGRIPGVMAVRVAGVFDADHYDYDRWLVYANLGEDEFDIEVNEADLEVELLSIHGLSRSHRFWALLHLSVI